MGYRISLKDRSAPIDCPYGDHKGCYGYEHYETVEVGHHTEGGQYVVGGTAKAELYVTYNYSRLFKLAWDEQLWPLDGTGDGFLGAAIGGKTARDTLERLKAASAKLGTRRYEADYWADTPGNAGHALSTLAQWATQHPDAVWDVS